MIELAPLTEKEKSNIDAHHKTGYAADLINMLQSLEPNRDFVDWFKTNGPWLDKFAPGWNKWP